MFSDYETVDDLSVLNRAARRRTASLAYGARSGIPPPANVCPAAERARGREAVRNTALLMRRPIFGGSG